MIASIHCEDKQTALMIANALSCLGIDTTSTEDDDFIVLERLGDDA